MVERVAFPAVEHGVVGVLRSASPDAAIALGGAAIEAGLGCVEITWTTPDAKRVVAELRSRYAEASFGAGSVFTSDQVEEARAAGAEFVVSPHASRTVAAACREAGLPYVPGTATPSEVVLGTEIGHGMVKIFPVTQLGGVAYLKALLGPFPELRAMVTGGVGIDETPAYLEGGAALVGLGSVFGADEDDTRRRVRRLLELL